MKQKVDRVCPACGQPGVKVRAVWNRKTQQYERVGNCDKFFCPNCEALVGAPVEIPYAPKFEESRGIGSVVTDFEMLDAMCKAGLVEFHEDTGVLVGVPFSDDKVKACYVKGAGPAGCDARGFAFYGIWYRFKYLDGCFFPFVVEAGRKDQNELTGVKQRDGG